MLLKHQSTTFCRQKAAREKKPHQTNSGSSISYALGSQAAVKILSQSSLTSQNSQFHTLEYNGRCHRRNWWTFWTPDSLLREQITLQNPTSLTWLHEDQLLLGHSSSVSILLLCKAIMNLTYTLQGMISQDPLSLLLGHVLLEKQTNN